ncbi:MAG: DUF58 domain-containing protein [Elusimicrobiota bacterium]|jgi:uncharacterized protein (DUF58 family)|nr:DUF58 domain-containing protein [Elusimicrobiota bacterium]
MQTSDILKRVRRIEIETGKLVSETFAGEYLSVFKGQGIEFAEVRQYIAGDDVRSIDWNVSARTGGAYVKKFNEERELSVMIACDVSGSQFFGSSGRFKSEAVAELGAVFAFSAIKNNDKVGLFLFSDRAELYIPPQKGKRHALRIIRELLAFKPQGRGTDISLCLNTLNRVIKRKGILLLISDFQDKGYEKPLRLAARKFDLIPVMVRDPLETAFPKTHVFINIESAEDGRAAALTPRGKTAGEITALHAQNAAAAAKLFAAAGADFININAAAGVVGPLVKFFRQRSKKLRK